MRAYTTCLLVALTFGTPRAAQARTDARVTAVTATLDLRESESARVELELRVQVRSGWMSSFELAGLDADLSRVVVAVAPDVAPPEVHHEGPGEVRLVWSDSENAPRRGEHRFRVAYTSRQLLATAARGASRRLSWTLPRWPERLAGVQVRVIGPPGITPAPHSEPNFGVHVAHDPLAEAASSLVYTRVELPRTEAWRIQVDLPPPAASTVGSLAQLRGVPLALLRSAHGESTWPYLLGTSLGLLVLAKRRLRRRDPGALALMRALEPARLDPLSFALCVLGAALLPAAPSLALACALAGVASGLERRDSRAISATELAAVRAKLQPAWFDATTTAGGALLGALYAAACLAPESARGAAWTCVWLATPMFFSRTRLHAQRNADSPNSLRRSHAIPSVS